MGEGSLKEIDVHREQLGEEQAGVVGVLLQEEINRQDSGGDWGEEKLNKIIQSLVKKLQIHDYFAALNKSEIEELILPIAREMFNKKALEVLEVDKNADKFFSQIEAKQEKERLIKLALKIFNEMLGQESEKFEPISQSYPKVLRDLEDKLKNYPEFKYLTQPEINKIMSAVRKSEYQAILRTIPVIGKFFKK